MRQLGVNMSVECDKEEVLHILRKNKENHAKMVKEARIGYAKEAAKRLKIELERLAKGKAKGLYISLAAPADYTSQYETVIKMLEMHKEPKIKLNANEVRMFVEDKWDWSQDFVGTNAKYANSVAELEESSEFEVDLAALEELNLSSISNGVEK